MTLKEVEQIEDRALKAASGQFDEHWAAQLAYKAIGPEDTLALVAEVKKLRTRWNDCDDCINGPAGAGACRCWDDS